MTNSETNERHPDRCGEVSAVIPEAAAFPPLVPFTAALLECVTPAEVVSVVVDRGVTLLGARAGLVALVSDDGASLEVIRTSGYSDVTMKGWERFSLAARLPLSDAVRENSTLLIESIGDWRTRYPDMMSQVKEGNFQAAASMPLAARGRVFGGLHFSFPDERKFSASNQALLGDLALQCALALDRALLLDRVEHARDAAQSANDRLRFLVRASELLSESLDYQTRLDALVRLCVPELADWGGVDVVGENGEIVRLAVAHRIPELESVMRELQERYPPEATNERRGTLTVIQSGVRVYYPSIAPELIDQGAVDTEHARLLKKIGVSAALSVPITVHGRTLGALSLGMGPIPEGSGRSFTEEAISLIEELARRAAVAVDNARLYAQAKRDSSERLEAERRFQFMANSAPVLIWTSRADGGCDWLNESWLNFTGRTMEQELGDGWLEGIHPEDLPQCLKAYRESFETRLPFRIEYRLKRYDGQYRWLLDNGVPLLSQEGEFRGYIGSCIDVTDQRRATERQRRFVRDMLRSVTEGRLCLCDTTHDLPELLSPAADEVELTPSTLRVLRKRVEAVAEGLHLAKDRTLDLLTAVGECSMNSVKHGGGGVGRVYADPTTRLIQVWIQDQGKGIPEENLHRATLEKGWSGADSFGHGFYLMLRTVDRTYLLTGVHGTTVVLEQDAAPPQPKWLESGI